MNETVARLIGIFESTKALVGADYYLDKFNNTILTDTDTIVFDEVINNLIELDVVPRGTKGSIITIDGFGRGSVRPDIISGTSPVTASELLALQVGGTAIVNGETIPKRDQIDLRHLEKLRRGYENTRRRMAYQIYLTGKVTLKSGEELDFQLKDLETKEIKPAEKSWYTFLSDLSDEFYEANGVHPTSIEVTKSLYDKIATSKEVLESANKTLKIEQTIENGIRKMNLGGLIITSLPIYKDVVLQGADIKKDNIIYLSNNEAFVKGYAALIKAEGDNIGVTSTEVLVGEDVTAYPAKKEYYLESAFIPIIPLRNSVARYKVTIK